MAQNPCPHSLVGRQQEIIGGGEGDECFPGAPGQSRALTKRINKIRFLFVKDCQREETSEEAIPESSHKMAVWSSRREAGGCMNESDQCLGERLDRSGVRLNTERGKVGEYACIRR